jgi:hypothetical protein
LGGRPPEAWLGVLDQVWFRGSFALDEIVFFHIAARVVIVADLIQALDENLLRTHWPGWSRLLARFGGSTDADPGDADRPASEIHRPNVRPQCARKILSWKCEKVIIAHGACADWNGQEFLRRAFSWLG